MRCGLRFHQRIVHREQSQAGTTHRSKNDNVAGMSGCGSYRIPKSKIGIPAEARVITMSEKVADVLWTMLEKAGVKRCYGIVGDALNPVIDALRRNGKIEFVHVSMKNTEFSPLSQRLI